MSLKVTIRLNYQKHRDIIEALENHKNLSEEVRRLMRKGIQAENGLIQCQPSSADLNNNEKLSNNTKIKNVNKEVSQEEIEDLETSFAFIDFGADE